MVNSRYMVLGMERMHFLAVKVLPVVVETVTCVVWSVIAATGEERWTLLGSSRSASLLAMVCAPVLLLVFCM